MATFLPSQHRTQIDKFTADGNTDMFYLTHRPVSVYAVRIDGMYKKTGHVGKQFFFLGYEALIDEYTKTLSFAAPPPNTGKQDNIVLQTQRCLAGPHQGHQLIQCIRHLQGQLCPAADW